MREFIKAQKSFIELDRRICFHTYNELKKSDAGRRRLQSYEEKWQKLGFIEGLNDIKRKECSFAYEQMAVYILSKDEDEKEFTENDLSFETIVFPMIRRVCTKLDEGVYNFKDFLKYCGEDYVNVYEILDKINKFNPVKDENGNFIPWEDRKFHIDNEAEAVFIACKAIEELFKDENADFKKLIDESLEEFYAIANKNKEKNKERE